MFVTSGARHFYPGRLRYKAGQVTGKPDYRGFCGTHRRFAKRIVDYFAASASNVATRTLTNAGLSSLSIK